MLGSGFVNSLARPNGNTTGVSVVLFESDGKRQDILIEAVPGLSTCCSSYPYVRHSTVRF
jgi:putative ABC transport system substrate-binding protein